MPCVYYNHNSWQPDCVQKDAVVHCKSYKKLFLIVHFVEKLYIVKVKLPEGSGVSGTALATGTSLLSLAPLLQMWKGLTWARRAMGKLDLWWVLKLQANQVSLLSCSRRIFFVFNSLLFINKYMYNTNTIQRLQIPHTDI